MESFPLIVAFVSVAVSTLFTLWPITTTRIASSSSRPGHEDVGDAGATMTKVESGPDQTQTTTTCTGISSHSSHIRVPQTREDE